MTASRIKSVGFPPDEELGASGAGAAAAAFCSATCVPLFESQPVIEQGRCQRDEGLKDALFPGLRNGSKIEIGNFCRWLATKPLLGEKLF